MTPDSVDALVRKLPLGDHTDQELVVRAVLRSLLIEGRRGTILADEVGFGKTYEALAITALLCANRGRRASNFRVLVLCKPGLVNKWIEEIHGTRPGFGFPQYLVGSFWQDHSFTKMCAHVRAVEGRHSADTLRREGLIGVRRKGRIQVPPGLYVVKQDLLTARNRATRPLLRQLFHTHWNVVIIDEAHHYARGNQPLQIFAPRKDFALRDQGLGDGKMDTTLALTATPFELDPRQLVDLVKLVRADDNDVEIITKGLKEYVKLLDRLFEFRRRSAQDPLRQQAIDKLRRLRDEDALGQDRTDRGLQTILRRYLIRNVKSKNERQYFLVNRTENGYCQEEFDKLDDLHSRVQQAPLIPFAGPDALFYLELRSLIQGCLERAREGEPLHSFVSTDLRQGLSSYPQLAEASLLSSSNSPTAEQLKKWLALWNSKRKRRLHPKVKALVEVVREITLAEIGKVKKNPDSWFSKVLVFSKLVKGTAPHLRQELQRALQPVIDQFVVELIRERGYTGREQLTADLRNALQGSLQIAKLRMQESFGDACRIPADFSIPGVQPGRHLLDIFAHRLERRVGQSLLLIRAIRCSDGSSDLHAWIDQEEVKPLVNALCRVVDDYLDDTPTVDVEETRLVEMAQRELIRLLEEFSPVQLVGRYDGKNLEEREGHRRGFNDYYNPFVLLVSAVGEEGIDLQRQCRYVIHYDLEWNPARMEQREGRVDRVGWGRASEGPMDVRFLLLKDTYEERIFHAVMQRDQWFQILIGSKRRELGELPSEAEAVNEEKEMQKEEISETPEDFGRLTEFERSSVMLDLRPEPIKLGCIAYSDKT